MITGHRAELCIQNLLNTAREFQPVDWGTILIGIKTSRLVRNLDNGSQWAVRYILGPLKTEAYWVAQRGGAIMTTHRRTNSAIYFIAGHSAVWSVSAPIFRFEPGSCNVCETDNRRVICGHQRLTIIRNLPSQSDRKAR
jgi:hypothetical protein